MSKKKQDKLGIFVREAFNGFMHSAMHQAGMEKGLQDNDKIQVPEEFVDQVFAYLHIFLTLTNTEIIEAQGSEQYFADMGITLHRTLLRLPNGFHDEPWKSSFKDGKVKWDMLTRLLAPTKIYLDDKNALRFEKPGEIPDLTALTFTSSARYAN